MFKQFITSGAIDFVQVDSTRLGGVNEVLAVLLMAAKYGVPVCPHAGGVGCVDQSHLPSLLLPRCRWLACRPQRVHPPAVPRCRLCEYVQHLSIIDYVCISTKKERRVLEYVDHLHECL